MNYLKMILTSEELWNFISVICSFIIVKITLSAEKKNNMMNLKVQKEQHKEILKMEEELHKESYELEKEQVRANLLPFLKLNQKIEMGKRNNCYTFPLEITNCGNSGAFDISVDILEEKSSWPLIYKEEFGDVIHYYQYTGFLFDNVLPIGGTGTFELLLYKFYQNEPCQENDINVGEIHFSVSFKDSMYNQYKQNYMIQYSTNSGCTRVESYLPQHVKENR